jgi:hypothetical protein
MNVTEKEINERENENENGTGKEKETLPEWLSTTHHHHHRTCLLLHGIVVLLMTTGTLVGLPRRRHHTLLDVPLFIPGLILRSRLHRQGPLLTRLEIPGTCETPQEIQGTQGMPRTSEIQETRGTYAILVLLLVEIQETDILQENSENGTTSGLLLPNLLLLLRR